MGANDGSPTRFAFILLGPTNATAVHLDTLASIARLMLDEECRYDFRTAQTKADLLAAIDRYLTRTAPVVPVQPDAVPEPLRYTGVMCGGLLNDLRRRLPFYASDFQDGLHAKSISSVVFLFFACLCRR